MLKGALPLGYAWLHLHSIVQHKFGASKLLGGPYNLAHANCTPLLEEKDLKNDHLKKYFFWTFATHMSQIPPKKYNFTQFAAFFHFLFFKINYYYV